MFCIVVGQNGFLNGGQLTNGASDFNAEFLENNQQNPSFFDSNENQSMAGTNRIF